MSVSPERPETSPGGPTVEYVRLAVTPDGGPWFTVADAAKYLQISERSVRRFLYSGQLKGSRPGGTMWRVLRRDLDNFMQQTENGE